MPHIYKVACNPMYIMYAPLAICFHLCANCGNAHMHCICGVGFNRKSP
jgi:hypothetical protein